MFDFRIRGTRLAPHFRSGVGYGPCGAVGDIMVEYSDFRRKTEVSTPLLYYRASLERPEVWRSEWNGERQSSGSALPIRQVVRHRSVSGDDECLAGRLLRKLCFRHNNISGLTEGSRLIPLCPLGKYSGVEAVAEMAGGFLGVSICVLYNTLWI